MFSQSILLHFNKNFYNILKTILFIEFLQKNLFNLHDFFVYKIFSIFSNRISHKTFNLISTRFISYLNHHFMMFKNNHFIKFHLIFHWISFSFFFITFLLICSWNFKHYFQWNFKLTKVHYIQIFILFYFISINSFIRFKQEFFK